jgi:hypothetical protein
VDEGEDSGIRDERAAVNGAAQPTLVVNDLKQPPAKGAIALWVGPGTRNHTSFFGAESSPVTVLGLSMPCVTLLSYRH